MTFLNYTFIFPKSSFPYAENAPMDFNWQKYKIIFY